MNKEAGPKDNSLTRMPFPFGDINNRRFITAVLAGVLGGAGVSSAANLLRQFREMRNAKKDDDTDDNTIVLNIPAKEASSGYDSMAEAKPGESKPTANAGKQLRDNGRFGKLISKDKSEAPNTKKADGGNPGPNTVGTIVANALGLTAGGLLSYEVVSRLFDRMNERRLKRRLEAAQQSYISALQGASKRAEAMSGILSPVEHVIFKDAEFSKKADPLDVVRYPAAAYILALLAGTGATAYVTKKVMDREFPEEKLKKDINKPTRIVFRTVSSKPAIMEGDDGEEKEASADTCAALTAMIPIYMDVVEGAPNRTLAEPYVKLAAAAGTDPAGLMKLAEADLTSAYKVILQDPHALWEILKGTNFGLNFSKLNAVDILRNTRPDTYRKAVDAAIDSSFAGGPNDGMFRRGWNAIAKAGTKLFSNLGGRDILVDRALSPKAAEADDLLRANYLASSIFKGEDKPHDTHEDPDPKRIAEKAKASLKHKRNVAIEAADPNAAEFVARRKDAIKKLLIRLNARGSI